MVAAEAIKGIYNIVLLSSGAPGITLLSKYLKILEMNIIQSRVFMSFGSCVDNDDKIFRG